MQRWIGWMVGTLLCGCATGPARPRTPEDEQRAKAQRQYEMNMKRREMGLEGSEVRVVRQAELVKDCEFLATVSASSLDFQGPASVPAQERARRATQVAASRKGADILLLQTESAGDSNLTTVIVGGKTAPTASGDAYRCKKPPEAKTP